MRAVATPDEMIKVSEAAARLGITEKSLRDGIKNHSIPLGIAFQARESCGERCTYLIPRKGFELWLKTGLTPTSLAIAMGMGKNTEQALAFLREALMG